jgi:hypothetical protein
MRHKVDGKGYGNIYTPHAGSMVIHVQREAGLANRTIVLSERQVALLRTVFSRRGLMLLSLFAATWVIFALQAARIPLLSQRIASLEHENRQLDTLTVALSRMHSRYDRIRQILGAGSVSTTASAAAAPDSAARSTADDPISTKPAIAAP